jgi:hypothetical protein
MCEPLTKIKSKTRCVAAISQLVQNIPKGLHVTTSLH